MSEPQGDEKSRVRKPTTTSPSVLAVPLLMLGVLLYSFKRSLQLLFLTLLMLSIPPVDSGANCTVLGIDLQPVVEDTCFSIHKLSPPMVLRWTVPVCPVQDNCTTIPNMIERNGRPIGRYNADWKILNYDGVYMLGVNYTRSDDVVTALLLFRCDPSVQSPLISNMTLLNSGKHVFYVITISHRQLCQHSLLPIPSDGLTASPTNIHTSFPTPAGIFYYVTNFDCNVTWANEDLVDDLPDFQLIIESLNEIFHVILTNALPSSLSDHVQIAVEESLAISTSGNLYLPSHSKFDTRLPWILHGVVQSSAEAAVFKVEKELRKLQRNNGELIGMLLERSVNYIDSIDVVNITSTTTSVNVLSEMSRHSPARILWIILGTICVFTLLVLSIQRLIEYCEDPANVERTCSIFRILYSRVISRFGKIKVTNNQMDDDDEWSESEAVENGIERRALLQQRK